MAGAVPVATVAQDGAPTTVTIAPVGDQGIGGLAILSPRDVGTAANVLAVGAPAGTTVVIHAGTCDAIDPAPVGLLGDLGTAGQISTVIPIALSGIADGAHVIAFHEGLDLSTAVGCGPILLGASRPSGAPGHSPGPMASSAVASFGSTTFGFRIDWAAPWTRLDLQSIPEIDAVRLGDGTSEVILTGRHAAGGDAQGCVLAWEGRLLGSLRDGSIAQLAPVTGADGAPAGGGDEVRSEGAYQFSLLEPGAPVRTIVERIDCRRLSGDAVLEITSDTPLDAAGTAPASIDALLAGLSLTDVVATPTARPTAAPVLASPPTATPEPTAVLAATPDAGCDGMDAWVPDTLARIDRLKGLAADANAATSNGMTAYAQQLATNASAVQQIRMEQQAATLPAAATVVQTDLLRMYQVLGDAYDLLAQAYRAGDPALLQEGLGTANEAETLSSSVRRALRDAATPCGITVPAS